MKKYLWTTCSLSVAILFAFAFTFKTNNNANQRVIGIHYLTLNQGIDKQEAENYLKNEWLILFAETPGMNASLGVADRGKSESDFVMIYTFDSRWTRDHYFPSEGQFGDEIKKVIEKHKSIHEKLFRYFNKEKYSHINYVLLAEAK